MTDRKLEIKRLIIYLLFAFGIAWCIFIAFYLTGHRWDGTNQRLETLVGLGMLAPLIAHVLTRLITKEGFAMTGEGSMMLGISFRDKKWKYYLIAMLLPWLYIEISRVLPLIIKPKLWDNEYYKVLEIDKRLIFIYPLIVIIQTTIISFAALGEEGGWRGYMMPKLPQLLGLKKAVVVGGIIWGIWHAPLTCVGHNFGTEYKGFPYVGILLMCLLCIFMGMMLTYVTVKSGSVWPAAILHAVNNGQPSILLFFINKEKYDQIFGIEAFAFLLIPIAVAGSICLALMIKGDKQTNK